MQRIAAPPLTPLNRLGTERERSVLSPQSGVT
jgi:hypothetical protein